ncbi:unnamed protein product, partial [Closterium sp. NIES-54]
MRTMPRASPAGLLLLALALIAGMQMMKVAHGDDTARSMTRRTRLRSMLKGAYGEGTVAETAGSRKVNARIAQEITTNSSTTDGSTTNGSTGGSNTDGTTGGSNTDDSNTGGSTTDSTSDPACAALGCEPDGKCVVDQNGERSCLWDSLCGACPSGATCRTVGVASDNRVVDVPFCLCPEGYGMTPADCVKGENATVSSNSMTLIASRTAKDNASRPYTFRLNLNACTPFPEAVAQTFTTMYSLENIPDAPRCPKLSYYSTDNCQGDTVATSVQKDASLKPSYGL